MQNCVRSILRSSLECVLVMENEQYLSRLNLPTRKDSFGPSRQHLRQGLVLKIHLFSPFFQRLGALQNEIFLLNYIGLV